MCVCVCVRACVCDSFGDGVNFPVRTIDEDYDSLLGQRQRWMEEGDVETETSPGECLHRHRSEVESRCVYNCCVSLLWDIHVVCRLDFIICVSRTDTNYAFPKLTPY